MATENGKSSQNRAHCGLHEHKHKMEQSQHRDIQQHNSRQTMAHKSGIEATSNGQQITGKNRAYTNRRHTYRSDQPKVLSAWNRNESGQNGLRARPGTTHPRRNHRPNRTERTKSGQDCPRSRPQKNHPLTNQRREKPIGAHHG